MRTTRHYARICLGAAIASLVFATCLAVIVVAPGIYEHYPQMLREALPFIREPFHLMLAALAVAFCSAIIAFGLASRADQAARFRRFLDTSWDRRLRHRYALT